MIDQPLFNHQVAAADFVVGNGGTGALFHEMGLGKTRTALEIFRRLREKEPVKLLVVCPVSLLNAAWAEEVELLKSMRHVSFRYMNLREKPKKSGQKWSVDVDAEIILMNFEMLIQEAHFGWIRQMVSKDGPWMLVVDESSRMKNHESKTTKALLSLRHFFKYRVVMSGTPAPNEETEYWAQLELLQPGILHHSFYGFRNIFFHLKDKHTGRTRPAAGFGSKQEAFEAFRKGWGYALNPAMRPELQSRLEQIAHIARKADCLDLPPEVDEVRKVEMGAAQRKAYEDMRRHLVAEIQGQEIAAMAALAKIMKLRQITSGFAYNAEGEALEVRNADLSGTTFSGPIADEFQNPKLEELMRVAEEAGQEQVIVWCTFRWEILKVCHELYKKYGDGQVVTLYSGTKDRDGSIDAFKKGQARFLVAHARSAAHGLTFVNCAIEVFLSLDYSWESYEQARARIHRAGQKRSCTYVHIVAKDSIDEKILDILRRKADAQELIYFVAEKA